VANRAGTIGGKETRDRCRLSGGWAARSGIRIRLTTESTGRNRANSPRLRIKKLCAQDLPHRFCFPYGAANGYPFAGRIEKAYLPLSLVFKE
jgi:hypothetical protein